MEYGERVGNRELVVLVLSIVLLLILLVDMLNVLSAESMVLLYWFDTSICIALLCDFFIGLYRSSQRRQYLRQNWLDFISSIPLVPVLRAGRVVRVLRILRLLRAVNASHRIMVHLRTQRRVSTVIATSLLVVLVGLVSSAAILEFEQGTNGNIRGAGDAIWWSITTMTTVGYGDHYPTTWGGKVVSIFPMLCGIGVFGLVTSLVSTWILGEEEEKQSDELRQIHTRLDAIEKKLDELVC
jgi:voltage-gated potassium channel